MKKEVKRSKMFRSVLMVACMISAMAGKAQFNDNPTLKIGDPAPPVKVKAWVKGKPVTKFEKGKVYVIDFWATWCGGCIASFPQINAIEEKYKGKVTFFSVDSYEDAGDNKDKDPVLVVKEFLQKPQGQKLKLNVCVDGNEKAMYNVWIKTLRRQGFPTTFIIDQEGRIAWIDVNLDQLDWALQQVLAKTWDRNKAADIMKKRDKVEDMLMAGFRDTTLDKKTQMKAMLATIGAFEQQYPDRKDAVAFYKFFALLEMDRSAVTPVLEQMEKDPLSRYLNLSDASYLGLQKDDLSRDSYATIARICERLLLYPYPEKGYGGKTVANYKNLADAYERAGESTKAVAAIDKAITIATDKKAPEKEIKELQEARKKYNTVKAG